MKKSLTAYVLVFLVCWGLTSSAQATLVYDNEEVWMIMDPYTSITCISYFIPDIPNMPDSLIFAQAPQWTSSIYFDYNSAGWDMVLADENKTACIFGPEITNSGSSYLPVFSFELYYQWDDADPNHDPNYPLYLDAVVFDDDIIISDNSYRGEPGEPYESGDVTWQEQNGGPPYENPVPEPATVCLLGLGSMVLFIRIRRPVFR